MENPIIQQTQDYSIFKQVNFNREKNKRHIQNLKDMLVKENLLHLHPILVNEKMEVVDGQHRLEAAKELSVPVFYIKSDLSYDHILNSNLFQKKLALEDVIKFFALKDKIPSYVGVYENLKKLNIRPKCFFGLIFGHLSNPLLDFIKTGKFQMPSDDSNIQEIISIFEKFLEFAHSKKIRPFSMFTNSDFSIAFRNLATIGQFNETVFFNKLDQRWFDLKPQLNSKEWTRQLISIYNWKNHNPLTINGFNEE